MIIDRINKNWFLTGLFVFSASLFFCILLLPITGDIVTKYAYGKTENIWTLAGLIFILSITYRRPGRAGYFSSLTVISIIFGITLATWFWKEGFSITTHMWGYLPTSDAFRYYIDSYNFLFTGNLTYAYRPLFNFFLSSMMALFQFDSKLILGFMGFLNIVGVFIASNQIKKSHGAFAAAVFTVASFLGYFYYIGTFMTEQLGFLFANISFALLWHATQTNDKRAMVLGLLAISFGLNVRAGAMLVLITIPLWVAWNNRERKIISIKWLAIALFLVSTGFAINVIFSNLFVKGNSPLFSNFGASLYGVAKGNVGWAQITQDYPGIKLDEMTGVALLQIKNDPLLFLKGIYRVYKDYFDPRGTFNALIFLRLTQKLNYIYIFLYLLLFFNIGYMIYTWREKRSSFLIFVFVGIVFSIPFAPMKDVGYRSYIVTNPYLITLLFLGICPLTKVLNSFIIKLANKINLRFQIPGPGNEANPIRESSQDEITLPASIGLLGLLALFMIVSPFIISLMDEKPFFSAEIKCPDGQIPVSLWTHPNAWVHIVADEELPQANRLPYLTYSSGKKLLSQYQLNLGYDEIAAIAKPGTSVGWISTNFQDVDRSRLIAYWGIVNTNSLPVHSGMLAFCGSLRKFKASSSLMLIQENLTESTTDIPQNLRDEAFDKAGQFLIVGLIVLSAFPGIPRVRWKKVISERQ